MFTFVYGVDAVELSLDPTMTEWERSRERDEFMRAAVLYKPSNSSLSSRFTHAKTEDDTDSVEVARDQEVGTHACVCVYILYTHNFIHLN